MKITNLLKTSIILAAFCCQFADSARLNIKRNTVKIEPVNSWGEIQQRVAEICEEHPTKNIFFVSDRDETLWHAPDPKKPLVFEIEEGVGDFLNFSEDKGNIYFGVLTGAGRDNITPGAKIGRDLRTYVEAARIGNDRKKKVTVKDILGNTDENGKPFQELTREYWVKDAKGNNIPADCGVVLRFNNNFPVFYTGSPKFSKVISKGAAFTYIINCVLPADIRGENFKDYFHVVFVDDRADHCGAIGRACTNLGVSCNLFQYTKYPQQTTNKCN